MILDAVNLHHLFQAITAIVRDANKVSPTNSDKHTSTRFARGGLGNDNLVNKAYP